MIQDAKMRMSSTARSGFTLVEILIVITIIGVLMAGIVPTIMRQMEKSKVKTTKTTIRAIQSALLEYNTDTSSYPNSLRDMIKPEGEAVKGWSGPYFTTSSVPKDGWDRPFAYQRTEDGEKPYELFSYGPKGKKGAKNERISVWDEK